jgi:hypothetical protein
MVPVLQAVATTAYSVESQVVLPVETRHCSVVAAPALEYGQTEQTRATVAPQTLQLHRRERPPEPWPLRRAQNQPWTRIDLPDA